MKAATERKIIRWFHILASIPILGYIYGPVAEQPNGPFVVRVIVLPAVILSGFWLWKGHLLRRRSGRKTKSDTPVSRPFLNR